MGPNRPKIGFVGLGAMGFGMATHLVKQGYSVKGFDVFPQSVQKFKESGGEAATSLEDSAKLVKVYICMVANAAQAQAALFDDKESVTRHLPQGAILLLCSTVPSSFALSVKAQLETQRPDLYFVDCPVSGGTFRAADGTLSIMAGASDAAIHVSRRILEEMSDTEKLFIVDGGVGQGSNMKMAHQVLAANQILATAEALGFAASLGLDPQETQRAILESEAWSWMFESRSPRALKADYLPPVSALTIILKDVGIITDMARKVGFPSMLCGASEQVYMSGLSRGEGADDDAAVIRHYFSEPLSTVRSSLNAEEKQQKTGLVIALLRAVNLCSAAEATAFAKAVGLPLGQFFELSSKAAGGSVMFNTKFGYMSTSSLIVPPQQLTSEIAALSGAIDAAQAAKCPVPLATASLNALLMSRGQQYWPWEAAKGQSTMV